MRESRGAQHGLDSDDFSPAPPPSGSHVIEGLTDTRAGGIQL